MPTTVVLDPVGTKPPPLTSPLAKDVIFTLNWKFVDLEPRDVLEQHCSIELSAGHSLLVQVGTGLRKFSFHLSTGTHFDPNVLTAQVRARLSPDLADPTAPNDIEHHLRIQFASAVLPEREAMTSVYGELNQELRRMRTLYETFLVVVTGGFATLVSQADKILGSPTYRPWMVGGIVGLAIIIAFLVSRVASRYNRTTFWLENIETALGLRVGIVNGPLITKDVPIIRKGGILHIVWALMLMIYTLALGILSATLVYTTPVRSPSPQTQAPAPSQEHKLPPSSPSPQTQTPAPSQEHKLPPSSPSPQTQTPAPSQEHKPSPSSPSPPFALAPSKRRTPAQIGQTDEDVLRQMVTEAVRRLNQGDATAIRDFWDENADYVGVGGELIRGRQKIEDFLAHLLKAGSVTQTTTIEQIRFLAPNLAIVDGSWTITSARTADGKQLPPIQSRGFEIGQKKQNRWRFIATREMVIWRPQ